MDVWRNDRKSGNELATEPISALCCELLNKTTRLGANVIKNLDVFAPTDNIVPNKS